MCYTTTGIIYLRTIIKQQKEKKMKKTNMYCRLGFHQYRWDWRKLCHTCMNCGAVKTGLFNTIKNIVLWFAAVLSIIALALVLLDTTAKKMDRAEQMNNCRYDYNNLCYTEEQKPWLF